LTIWRDDHAIGSDDRRLDDRRLDDRRLDDRRLDNWCRNGLVDGTSSLWFLAKECLDSWAVGTCDRSSATIQEKDKTC